MSNAPAVGMIWAQASNGIIGRDGDMPWFVPEDFAHFKNTTMGAPVIMGRTTWESLPEISRPLPGRTNIVLTSDTQYRAPGATLAHSTQDALNIAQAEGEATESSTIWIMGGGEIYRQFMTHAQTLVITDINLSVEGDTHAPLIPQFFALVQRQPETGWNTSRTGVEYAFSTYQKEGDIAPEL